MKEGIGKLLDYIQQQKELSRAVSTDMPSEDAVEIVKREFEIPQKPRFIRQVVIHKLVHKGAQWKVN